MRSAATVTPDFVVPVSRLANYLKRKIERDDKLRCIGVSGEVSNYRPQLNGNVYFDLKDRDAVVSCFAWSASAASFPPLANGLAIVATGSVGVYTKKTTLSLTVNGVELEGAGRLHALYEALKARLRTDGLFDERRKRALPRYPFHIALVSSKTANGAADFITQANAHAPQVFVELFETSVQGPNAALEIVRAIDRASRSRADLVIVARGGGSYEDLFVFNDERVVRALARCAHPTVSAIGHEADTPLTDFVADHRAATPSTAAQTLLPKRADLLRAIAQTIQRLDRAAARNVTARVHAYERVERRSPLAVPNRLLTVRRQTVDAAADELQRAVAVVLAARARALMLLRTRLEAVNPSVRLSRRRERLAVMDRALQQSAGGRLRREAQVLAALSARLQAANPSARLSRGRERLGITIHRLDVARRSGVERRTRRLWAVALRLTPAVAAAVAHCRGRFDLLEAKLDGRNPTAILQRGYAIVTQGGRILRDPLAAEPGSAIAAQLAGGTLVARVEAAYRDGGDESGHL